MSENWAAKITCDAFDITDDIPFQEAGLLKLNCDKALFHLKWEATLNYKQTIKMTADWYSAYYVNKDSLHDVTMGQISDYEKIALAQGHIWTK